MLDVGDETFHHRFDTGVTGRRRRTGRLLYHLRQIERLGGVGLTARVLIQRRNRIDSCWNLRSRLGSQRGCSGTEQQRDANDTWIDDNWHAIPPLGRTLRRGKIAVGGSGWAR